MTQDKDILENLEFLDKILDYLIHNCKAYYCSFDELYRHFYNRDLETDNKFNAQGYYTAIAKLESNNIEDVVSTVSIPNNTQAQGEKLVEACYYLMKQNYVRIDSQFNIKITFEGILKCSENFISTHYKSKTNFERLTFVEDTQLNQNSRMVDATEKMMVANQSIRNLTFWIMVGAVVAIVYQAVELLKTFFPSLFFDAPKYYKILLKLI